MAPMRLMRAAMPAMARRAGGGSSTSPPPRVSGRARRNMAYSVAKAAQLSLSRAYADRYARDGVLVNAVTPGPVADELWLAPGGLADQTAAARGITPRGGARGRGRRAAPRRLASAGEIAAVIVFLCSEPASNVAGAAWSVDGGAVPVII